MMNGAFEEYQDLLKRLENSLNNEKSYISKIKRIEKEYDALDVMYKNELKLRRASEADAISKHSLEGNLLKSGANPLFLMDKNLVILYHNEAALTEFGGEAKNLNGALIKDIFTKKFSQEASDKCIAGCQNVFKTKKPCTYMETIVCAESGERAWNMEISYGEVSEKGAEGLMLIIHDVTNVYSLARDEKRLSALKSEVLSEIKYEIKNPLNSVKGMSDLLIKSGLEKKQEHYVNKIKASSEVLLNIIDYSIDFSQIEDEKLEIINNKYEFASFIQNIVNVFAIKTASKKIDFIVDIDPNIPSEYLGDSLMLKQVITGLLSNCLRHTEEGFIRINISAKKDDKNCVLCFEIVDSGTGISKENMDALNDALVHKNPVKYIDPLFAFNYILADKITRLMNGKVTIDSEHKKGTKITVEILQEIANNSAIAHVNDFEKKRIVLLGKGGNFEVCKQVLKKMFVSFDVCDNDKDFKALIDKNEYTHVIYWYEDFHKIINANMLKIASKKIISVRKTELLTEEDYSYSVNTLFEPVLVTELFTTLNLIGSSPNARKELSKDSEIGQFMIEGAEILVVDDNEINLIVAEEMLKIYGVEPDSASDGSIAVDLAYQKKYDMIFMDHLMPGMDGLEAASRIKKENTLNMDTPIIAFTANSIVGMRETFLESGMSDYMTKPIETKELNRILYKWLPENKIVLENHVVEQVQVSNSELFDELLDKLQVDGYSSVRNLDGKENIYMSILDTFVNTLKAKIESLDNNFQTKSYNLYRIEVHALKSSLANIGADNLSELAKKLEISEVNGDLAYIDAHNDEFITGLKNLYDGLREILSKSRKKDEIIDKESMESADITNKEDSIKQLSSFLEMLDTTSALEIIEELDSLNFGEEVNALVEELKISVDSFDYDKALSIIEQLLNRYGE